MKQFTIIIAPKAEKQINKLPSKIKPRVANALDLLSHNPYIGKPLKAELKGLYSYRISDYRVIYNILQQQLIIQVWLTINAFRRVIYNFIKIPNKCLAKAQ